MPTWTKKKYMKLAKGFWGKNKNCLRVTIPKVEKSLQYAYISRRLRPRDLRREWITNIGSAVKEHNINYSKFIYGLNNSNVDMDRKILAELCYTEPFSFKAIVDEVKIQGKLKDKVIKEMTYQEAIENGHIIESTPIEKPEIPETFNIFQNIE